MIRLLFKYEYLHFTRNRFQVSILFLTILLGFYAIYYGCTEIEKQNQVIRQVKQSNTEQLLKITDGFKADTTTSEGKKAWQLSAMPGYAWHRHQFAAAFEPSALAPLSIGQRDLQPYYYKLSAMSLYYQVFQNEIANPQKLLAGNFDLSFVLVYLFPLLIIAFCYSILSSEKDKGVLPLLKSQSIAIRKIISFKLLFYFVLLTGIAILLCITGFIFSGAGITNLGEMILWILTVLAYFIFWFTVLFVIISLNKNSAFNAITGIGCWLFFLIIIPALINIVITVTMPLNSHVLSGISRRTGVFDEEIEENHKVVIREFLKAYPEYHSGDTAFNKNLFAKGHAAFTVLKDGTSRKLVESYQNQVNQRDQIAGYFNMINPAVSAQSLFDAITKSNLYAFQSFNKSVTAFHRQLVRFYYSRLFSDKNLKQSDYLSIPEFNEKSEVHEHNQYVLTGIIQLFLSSVLLFFIAYLLAGKTL